MRDLANFAGALHGLGRLAEAEPIYRQTWEANKRVLGPDHQRTLIAMQNLGTLLSAQGRHAEAETLLRELLDVAQRTLGPDHPRTVRAIDVLGVALRKQKKHAEAEALARQSMEINARVHGDSVVGRPSPGFGVWSLCQAKGVRCVLNDWSACLQTLRPDGIVETVQFSPD